MIAYAYPKIARGKLWWVFITKPLCFHVYWRPDGTKTLQEFFEEQLKLAQEYSVRYPIWYKGD